MASSIIKKVKDTSMWLLFFTLKFGDIWCCQLLFTVRIVVKQKMQSVIKKLGVFGSMKRVRNRKMFLVLCSKVWHWRVALLVTVHGGDGNITMLYKCTLKWLVEMTSKTVYMMMMMMMIDNFKDISYHTTGDL